jgi:hypothetical protein
MVVEPRVLTELTAYARAAESAALFHCNDCGNGTRLLNSRQHRPLGISGQEDQAIRTPEACSLNQTQQAKLQAHPPKSEALQLNPLEREQILPHRHDRSKTSCIGVARNEKQTTPFSASQLRESPALPPATPGQTALKP